MIGFGKNFEAGNISFLIISNNIRRPLRLFIYLDFFENIVVWFFNIELNYSVLELLWFFPFSHEHLDQFKGLHISEFRYIPNSLIIIKDMLLNVYNFSVFSKLYLGCCWLSFEVNISMKIIYKTLHSISKENMYEHISHCHIIDKVALSR